MSHEHIKVQVGQEGAISYHRQCCFRVLLYDVCTVIMGFCFSLFKYVITKKKAHFWP